LDAGRYTAELVQMVGGTAETLAGPEPVDVIDTPAVDGTSGDTDFAQTTADLRRRIAGAAKEIDTARDRFRHLRVAVAAAPGAGPDLHARLDDVHRRVEDLARRLTGDPVRVKLNDPADPSVRELVDRVGHFHWSTTRPPTATQRTSIDGAATEFTSLRDELTATLNDLAAVTSAIDDAGGTWTPR
ncbi:hypothetical protein OAM92_01835, partial [Acidimicrobiales bacterium]|nr:hypothetical protein [Acidimicrobiales bacterium]